MKREGNDEKKNKKKKKTLHKEALYERLKMGRMRMTQRTLSTVMKVNLKWK